VVDLDNLVLRVVDRSCNIQMYILFCNRLNDDFAFRISCIIIVVFDCIPPMSFFDSVRKFVCMLVYYTKHWVTSSDFHWSSGLLFCGNFDCMGLVVVVAHSSRYFGVVFGYFVKREDTLDMVLVVMLFLEIA